MYKQRIVKRCSFLLLLMVFFHLFQSVKFKPEAVIDPRVVDQMRDPTPLIARLSEAIMENESVKRVVEGL